MPSSTRCVELDPKLSLSQQKRKKKNTSDADHVPMRSHKTVETNTVTKTNRTTSRWLQYIAYIFTTIVKSFHVIELSFPVSEPSDQNLSNAKQILPQLVTANV